jgi:hypothetical protein
VDRDALAGSVAFGKESLHESGADTPSAVFGQERDVDDPDLARAAVDVEAPGRLAVDEDDVEGRLGVRLAIPRILRVELRAEEGFLLGVVPRNDRELLRPRARVDATEELSVARLDRA